MSWASAVTEAGLRVCALAFHLVARSGGGRVAAVVAATTSATTALSQTPSITGFNGGSSAYVYALSADGTVAGGSSRLDGSGPSYAFEWTRSDGFALLHDADGNIVQGSVYAVSADGSTLVGNIEGPAEAVRWSSGQFQRLGHLPGTDRSWGLGASGDGSVVVGFSTLANDNQAFRWSQETGMVRLPLPPDASPPFVTVANSITPDGSFIAGSATASGGFYRPTRWTASGAEAIVLPQSTGGAFGEAIAADGQTIVGSGYNARGQEAFRWQSDGSVDWLGHLGGSPFRSEAFGVSADGSVVVGRAGLLPFDAFIWDEQRGMRSLENVLRSLGVNMNGWDLLEATSISADGRTIGGRAIGPGFVDVGFVAVIPAPGAGVLVGAFLLSAARRFRRPTT